MIDFINKVIGIMIAFFILVVGSLTITALSVDLTAKRIVLNEMSNFIDMVEDTGVITDQQLADFYLTTSATGITMDVDIKRLMRTVNPKESGSSEVVVSYLPVDEVKKYNDGDHIKVRVRAIDYTGGQKILWYMIKVFSPKLDVTLAGVVDNG